VTARLGINRNRNTPRSLQEQHIQHRSNIAEQNRAGPLGNRNQGFGIFDASDNRYYVPALLGPPRIHNLLSCPRCAAEKVPYLEKARV
jgi:hypothetical protein